MAFGAFLILSISLMIGAFVVALQNNVNVFYFMIGISGILAFGIHLIWQLKNLDINSADNCLMIFRSNRNAGLLPYPWVLLAPSFYNQ